MARPGRWRRFVLRPLVWAVAVLAVLVGALALFLRTDTARERARVLLVARASEALGRDVAVGRVEYELFPTTFVFHDVVVPGDRPGAGDFARARRIEVEADFEGLRQRVLELRRVAVEGLDLTLELRADGDNLPRSPRGVGSGRRLAVSIGGVSVDDSRVHVDERTVPVSVKAGPVLARLTGVGGTDLDGSLAVQDVELVLPSARPARFAFSGRTRILEDRVELSDARLSSPELAVRASGRVGWRGGASVDLTAAVEGSGALLDRLGYLDGGIRGPFRAEGVFAFHEREWSWRADVESPALELFGFDVEELAGVASGDRGGARFEIERGRFEGGELSGRFEIGLERELPARLDVGVDGADLDAVLSRFEVPVHGLAARVRGELEYAFEARRAASGTGSGSFEVTPEARPGDRLPATGSVEVLLEGGRLELPAFALATPGQELSGRATVRLDGGGGEIALVDRSSDLGELSRLVDFLPADALWVPTAGRGTIEARVALAAGGPEVEARLELEGVEAAGARADRLAGELVVGPRAVERLDLALARGDARLDLAGRVPLDERDRTLALELLAEGWPVEDARPWLPFELPLVGAAQGRLRLSGSTAEPAGELVATLEPATVAGFEAQRLEAELTFDPERVEVGRARLVAEAGEIAASGRLLHGDGALDFAISSAGLDLARPPFAVDAAQAAGRFAFDARIGGTLEAPEAALDGRVDGLVVAGQPIEEGTAPVSLRWSRGRIEADAKLGELASISGGGDYDPDRPARLVFRVESGRLERLLALVTGATPAGVSGNVAGEAVLELGPDVGPALAIVVPELRLRYAEHEVRALEPVAARLDAGGLRLESLYLGLPGGEDELFVSGVVALGEEAALDLNVQTSLAASWFRPWLAGVEPGGRVEALARVRGTPARPAVSGQAEWADGRYLPPGLPHAFERVRALVLFYPDAVVVDRLTADFANGDVTASGRVDLPAPDRALAYRLEASARRLAPRWPPGWQLRGDAHLTLTGGSESRQVRGEIRLDRAWYLQDIDLSPAQLVQRLLARGRVEVAETDEALATTHLSIAVVGPDAFRVRNNLARLAGGAELSVRGTLASPVLFGEIRLEPGGTVEYAGNTYTIERGRVTFANPARLEPLLDVVARARVDQYGVTVNLGGPLERLNTTFASDPPLPDLDILALLATGSPSSTPGLTDLAPQPGAETQSVAAEALLYGQAASLVTARVGRMFGFDQVRIEPLTAGSDSVSTARVTIGKRLSRKLYVTYSVDPSSTAEQILQAEWRLSDNLVLVLTQNGNDSYAVDARWESRF